METLFNIYVEQKLPPVWLTLSCTYSQYSKSQPGPDQQDRRNHLNEPGCCGDKSLCWMRRVDEAAVNYRCGRYRLVTMVAIISSVQQQQQCVGCLAGVPGKWARCSLYLPKKVWKQKVGFLGEIKACQESFKSTSPGKPQVVLAFLRCGWVDVGIGGGIGERSKVES